jgi:hypothetical protein
MFEQTFKNIDNILYKDAGAYSELDYIGQTSWILFLKYLDDLEKDRADEAELYGQKYKYVLPQEYRCNATSSVVKNGMLCNLMYRMNGLILYCCNAYVRNYYTPLNNNLAINTCCNGMKYN